MRKIGIGTYMESVNFLNDDDQYALRRKYAWENREKGRICPPYGIWKGHIRSATVNRSKNDNQYLLIPVTSDIDFIPTDGEREYMFPKMYFFCKSMPTFAFGKEGMDRLLTLLGGKPNDSMDIYDYQNAFNELPFKDIWFLTKQELFLPIDTDGLCKFGKGNIPVILRQSKVIDFDEIGSRRLLLYFNREPLIVPLSNSDMILIEKSRKLKSYVPYRKSKDDDD